MKNNHITDAELQGIPSSVKHKTNILFLLAQCCDLMVWSVEGDLHKLSSRFSLNGDVKRRFGQYREIMEHAQKHFENFIEPQIISSGAADNFGDYEKSRRFANELVRLVMTYYEQCCANVDNHKKVFDLLCSLKGGMGVFSSEEINKFDLGCNRDDK